MVRKKTRHSIIKRLVSFVQVESLRYRVSQEQVSKIAPINGLIKNASWTNILLSIYPNHNWDIGKLSTPKAHFKPSQRMLALSVQDLFPKHGFFCMLLTFNRYY